MHLGNEGVVASVLFLATTVVDNRELHQRFGESMKIESECAPGSHRTTPVAVDIPDARRMQPTVFLTNDHAVHVVVSHSVGNLRFIVRTR